MSLAEPPSSQPNSQTWRFSTSQWALLACVVILCCALNYSVYKFFAKAHQESLQVRLSHLVDESARALEQTISVYENSLRATGLLFDASGEVSRETFSSFVIPLMDHLPGLTAIEWTPKVALSKRNQHERSISKDLKNYEIKEYTEWPKLGRAGQRESYFPIAYTEPYRQNNRAIGFDHYSHNLRREMMDLAQETRQLTTSLPLRLFRLPKSEFVEDFLLFAPVFEREQTTDLKGFVIGVLRLQKVLHSLPNFSNQQFFELEISIPPLELSRSIYRSEGWSSTWDGIHTVAEIRFLQRNLQIKAIPTQTFFHLFGSSNLHYVLSIGIVCSILIIVIALQALRQTALTKREVKKRTAELERINVDLVEHQKELNRSNQELSQFAYVASHDLKAPLRAIENYSRWVIEDCEEKLPSKSREHLNKLNLRVNKMEELLEDLLKYSRIGRHEESHRRVETKVLVSGIVELLTEEHPFKIEIAEDLPVLMTSKEALEQVFRNLVGNAIKHHDKTEGWIKVATTIDDNNCEFSISDNGPGIDPSFHDKIFDMFQTLKPKDQVSGTGMGLALVKKIVENQGGKIRVESELGRGSTFRFTWPSSIA